METPSAMNSEPDQPGAARASWLDRLKNWSRYPDPKSEPAPGHRWPSWVCWLVSALLLFHVTATVACELADQWATSSLTRQVGRWFWSYIVLINQDYAHAYFAPNPEPRTPVVTARLRFKTGGPYHDVRLPDKSTQPRIRYVRQIAMAWHLTHESKEVDFAKHWYWARSYAKHLCRAHPDCDRISLLVQWHRAPNPNKLLDAIARSAVPDYDSDDWFSPPQLIGEFACDDL